MYEHLSLWTQVHFLHKTLHYFEIFEALLSVYVTFPHPLFLHLCSGDLIGFGLLIFLQLLRILHLLPLCLIEVALQKHKYCYIVREENSLNLDTCRRYNYQVENTTASENSLVLVFLGLFFVKCCQRQKPPRRYFTLQMAKRLRNKAPSPCQC